MLIHPKQQNVQLLCELAEFIDSGHQRFIEQVRPLSPRLLNEAAVFPGAATMLKLIEHFSSGRYTGDEVSFMLGMVADEVNQYLERNRIDLEWEPHVPRSWQQ